MTELYSLARTIPSSTPTSFEGLKSLATPQSILINSLGGE